MATRTPDGAPWPAVTDPAGLLTAIADWLGGYGNLATRRTYAEGLGLPTSHPDLHEWLRAPDENWRAAVARYAAALGTLRAATEEPGATSRGSTGVWARATQPSSTATPNDARTWAAIKEPRGRTPGATAARETGSGQEPNDGSSGAEPIGAGPTGTGPAGGSTTKGGQRKPPPAARGR